MAKVETLHYFCPVCRKPFPIQKTHHVVPQIKMRDGSPSAVHAGCYGETRGREIEFGGNAAWLDQAVKNVLVDSVTKVPVFVIEEDLDEQVQERLRKRGA